MQQFWIFGYGSLMWKPGFEFAEREPALLKGMHRKLCVYSHVHRGSPECPGLVMGLDLGGSCHGMAYRVDEAQREWTLEYLRAREQVTSVYLEQSRRITLLDTGRQVEAVTYVADRKHKQYAGRLSHDTLLKYVRQGRGVSGHCIDYVLNTAAHLREMNMSDSVLERLVHELAAQANSRET